MAKKLSDEQKLGMLRGVVAVNSDIHSAEAALGERPVSEVAALRAIAFALLALVKSGTEAFEYQDT